MNIAEHLKRSAILGLGISMLLALVLSTWVFRAEESDLRLQQRQRTGRACRPTRWCWR